MKINVIGAGPAGLYFALLMKKLAGAHEIIVYERDPADNTYGWGIVLSKKTLASLRGADFETYREIVHAAQTWENVDVIHRGQTISVSGNHFSGLQRITFLSILQKRCRELGVQLRFETPVTGLDAVMDCDLLVGADGLKSMVRETFRDHFQTSLQERRNKYIWLGTPEPFDALTMMFRQHNDGLYIAHAYKFNPAQSTFIVECDPETWRRAGFQDMTEGETCSYLAEIFRPELAGRPLLSDASKWYNFFLVKNRHWYYRHTVLLGDALHSVHFSIGSGTKLAIEDAITLAGSFAEEHTVPRALAAFEKTRKPGVDAFQDAALDSLQWLEEVREDLHLDPLPFAYKLMTRSNRITRRRLKAQDPGFVERYETWRWKAQGPVHEEFLDLFRKKAYAHLATLRADGRPHVTPVWVDYDGEYILVNSARGRQKDLNMECRRHVALEISDPENPNRYLAVQGEVVEITEEGAEEHLDGLAKRYLERDRYPQSWRFPGEVRRVYKIRVDRVMGWDPFGGW